MCGIAGFIDLRRATNCQDLTGRAEAMAQALRHRGPDEQLTWTDEAAGIALAFARLAIIDLSSAGRQPMVSANGRYAICYNGEVFNADEMKASLGDDATPLRGHSDTEVLLEAIAKHGVERAIGDARGMFAIALWDRCERRLWLIRDRLGKKPLYWSEQNGHFLFASELRALRVHPAFEADIDRDALVSYVRRGYYHYPNTVYRNVQQLPPGHMLRLEIGRAPEVSAYWSLIDAVDAGMQGQSSASLSPDKAIDALESVLGDAVRRRMVADVPLGAFLSGGYDSSTVVALMQSASSRPVQTFSIGFKEDAFDEAPHARAVAKHLGTDHTELIVTPAEAQDVVPNLPDIFDEPFADSSQIPTFLVSRMARRHVTVALSGDGGDELFAGYNRYAQGARWHAGLSRLPRSVKRSMARTIQAVGPGTWDIAARVVPAKLRPRLPGDKLYKLAGVIDAEGDDYYKRLTSLWSEPAEIVAGGCEPADVTGDLSVRERITDLVSRMQYFDTLTYLPGDILTKVDRASMAVSLEARTPLLDHKVVEFAWSLPKELKLRNGQAKWALRQVLYRHVPPKLVDRAKAGFGIPIADWLRGPLRAWAEDLLSEHNLKSSGLFHPQPVRSLWSDHLSGRRNREHALWTVLMFEAWRRAHH